MRATLLLLTLLIGSLGQAQSGIAEVNNTRLYFERAGAGPVVVLLHGGNLDSRMWDDQFVPLSRSFTVVRHDIRPYGRSAPSEKGFSSVEDLRALLDHLQITRASLVGLSLGGRIAVDFTLAYPDRVDKLVLMGPGLTGYRFKVEDDQHMKRAIGRAVAGDPKGAMELWLEHPMMKPAMSKPALADRIRSIAMDNLTIWQRLGVGERVSNPPAMQRLSEIRKPTLLIVGEKDVPDIQAIVKLLAAGIVGSRTEVIPDAGHMPNMEAPERVNQLLAAFLR
jgi:3-oxoadipate enol-lactonase